MNKTRLATLDAIRSDVEPGDDIILFPTFGWLAPNGQSWRVGVAGVVFEQGPDNLRKRMLLRVLQRLMQVPASDLDNELFRRRIRCFLVLTERGKRIAVRIGNQTHLLQRPSKRNGHFRGSVTLPDTAARRHGRTGWVDVDVITQDGAVRACGGQIQLIGEQGLSIISDIDDTIKQTEVAHRRKLLRNTFLNEFRAVQGMSRLYQSWAHVDDTAFHYVSSSPWQLYNCLRELLQLGGFPDGSIHLRAIRLRDPSVLRLFVARRASKRRVIRMIIRTFPKRRFVLVGDSGEKDLEIYGSLARQFGSRVEKILIRRVEGRLVTSERLRRAFRDVPENKWQLFREPNELSDLRFDNDVD